MDNNKNILGLWLGKGEECLHTILAQKKQKKSLSIYLIITGTKSYLFLIFSQTFSASEKNMQLAWAFLGQPLEFIFVNIS